MDGLDLSTQQGSQSALTKLNETLTTVLNGRAKAGALHQKLIHMHGMASSNRIESDATCRNFKTRIGRGNLKNDRRKYQIASHSASMAQARSLSLSSMRELMAS